MNSPETQTSAAQEAAPVRVGKNTVIQRPYNGTVPKVKKGTQYEIVSISSTALEQAETQITAAQAQAESGKSFKKSLTSFYREAMGNLFGGRAVQVENVRFEDQPYDVTLNTKVISKVISDPHLTAEKLAVFRHIENVVRNAEYLGSGQYTAHGAKTKPATRYDYFETQAIIGGQEYTVSFDVEVYPDRNNYRTHRVVNNLELSPAADGTNNTKKERPPVSAVQTAYSGADARTIQAAAERGFVPYNSIAQTGENATGFSGPAAERTSDVSAVPSALNPAPRLYTRAEVQGMSAGEVRENYDAIQESMRLWDKNGELLQSAETETARRMALETGRAGKTDLDWLEHLAGTAKMELQYVFQPGSGVQAAVQGRRITVNLGGEGYAFGAAVHELGHSMKAADAKAYAKFESAVLGLAQSDAALEQIARQTAADYLSPDSPARAGLLDAQGNIDAAALNEEISLRLAQELVADPEKLVRAVERDRGLMETFLDFVRGLKNRIAIRLSGSERAMLDEAERTLVNLLRGEAGSVAGEKYSFVRATDVKDVKMVDGKDISKNDLTSTLLETKPKNSPNPQKWLDKQGKISIDKQGVWSYTNDKGQTVKYPDGYPDFKGAGLVRQEVDIGKFKDYITDFKKADALAPNGPRNAVKNTWHHSQDGHTLQEVNKVIHKEFTHRGGMALKVMK